MLSVAIQTIAAAKGSDTGGAGTVGEDGMKAKVSSPQQEGGVFVVAQV
jgi:hypothetical protein